MSSKSFLQHLPKSLEIFSIYSLFFPPFSFFVIILKTSFEVFSLFTQGTCISSVKSYRLRNKIWFNKLINENLKNTLPVFYRYLHKHYYCVWFFLTIFFDYIFWLHDVILKMFDKQMMPFFFEKKKFLFYAFITSLNPKKLKCKF